MARKTLISTLYAGAFTKRGVKLYGGIALLAIIIIAIVYFNTQMRPVDLLSKFESENRAGSGRGGDGPAPVGVRPEQSGAVYAAFQQRRRPSGRILL